MEKTASKSKTPKRSIYLSIFIAVLYFSIFFVAGSSKAHTIKGYAILKDTDIKANHGYVEVYRVNTLQNTLHYIMTDEVTSDGYFEVVVPNGNGHEFVLRILLPRNGEEIEVGVWYPSALTWEEADRIIFPPIPPNQDEDVDIFFLTHEDIEASQVSSFTGTVFSESKYGVRNAQVTLRANGLIYASAVTDAEGNFVMPNVPYGHYEMVISSELYPSVIEQVYVVGETFHHSVSLQSNISFTVGETAEFYRLEQNYPNPFNPETNISFSIPNDAKVTLVVTDMVGREVATLISNEDLKAGYYSANFNASTLASGVYMYRINAIGENGYRFTDTKRMILVK